MAIITLLLANLILGVLSGPKALKSDIIKVSLFSASKELILA